MNRLKERYAKEISPALVSKFSYKSVMQVPKVDKIVINMGVGDAVQIRQANGGAGKCRQVRTGNRCRTAGNKFDARAGGHK